MESDANGGATYYEGITGAPVNDDLSFDPNADPDAQNAADYSAATSFDNYDCGGTVD